MTDPNSELEFALIKIVQNTVNDVNDSFARHRKGKDDLETAERFICLDVTYMIEDILPLIARATREARREELKKLSWAVVESCEPECNAVRHARHEGTWNAHLIIEERLAVLDSGEGEE